MRKRKEAQRRNKKSRRCEIIEFPMILFNCETCEEEAVFHEYVRPPSDPVLSAFCTRLTGISQYTVAAADTFPHVFKRAMSFLREHHVSSDDCVCFGWQTA